MTRRPFILLTNDDGIHAPGLRHLWEAIQEYADVAIVAPSSEKSGSGLSITWTNPLIIQEVPWAGTTAWCVNGTPADCVKMALSVILPRRPDMVVSGINCGSNAGRTVLYSGTVGGVIEATLKDIPGIAFSFSDFETPPLEATKKYIFPLIQHFLNHPLPSGTLLNVNFPLGTKERVNGFKLTGQGRGWWLESPEKRDHPHGTPYYWLGGKWVSDEQESPEGDVYWLDKGYLTATPLHVGELTCRSSVAKHKNTLEAKFNMEEPAVLANE